MRIASAVVFCGLFGAALVTAQEAPKPAVGEQSPQPKGEERDLTGWAWINFVILAGVLGYLASKHANPFFHRERDQIRARIEDARRRSEDADRRAHQVQERLANLSAEIEVFRREAGQERQREIENLRRRLEADIAAARSSAEAQLQHFQKTASLELRRHASRLAVEAAERRIREQMNPGLQHTLTDQFVQGLRG